MSGDILPWHFLVGIPSESGFEKIQKAGYPIFNRLIVPVNGSCLDA